MDWAWATSLDSVWRSASFPMWLTLAAAGFFGLIALITLWRAEISVANGALTVITLLAIGIAVAATLRGSDVAASTASGETRASVAAPPAMSCIDDLAGDTVGQACEKAVFGSAESTAAAVNYAAAMISRLTALGDVATSQRTMSTDMQALRRAVEHDRYGLMAQVLSARDRCTPTDCAVYRSLTDNHQIITNMDEHLFDSLVARYAPSWNAPPAVAATASTPLSMLPTSVPTGRPTNAEFPSAADTPAVSIMTPEPRIATPASKPAAAASAPPAARPAQAAATPSPSPSPASKREARPARHATPAPPTQISPAAPAPAASND